MLEAQPSTFKLDQTGNATFHFQEKSNSSSTLLVTTAKSFLLMLVVVYLEEFISLAYLRGNKAFTTHPITILNVAVELFNGAFAQLLGFLLQAPMWGE
mmetsp:Transcript_19957/g.34085  ORF Transcript_19957/g.34085 Transcript_19957/m.34085 type:complete len:98 (-) Transcript_19957:386-679(-)